MRMRTLLATLCLLPALAAAQTPVRPPRPPPGGQAPGVQPPGPPPGGQAPGAQPATPPAPRLDPKQPTSPAGAAPVAAPTVAAPTGQTFTPVKADSRCTPIQGRFLLSFNKADILDILEQASRWTCRNFIYSEDVAKGKITLLSKTAVTADEAYAAFLAALTSNGIAVYQTGKYWKLVRTGDAKKTPIPTYTSETSETPATEQPITRLIRLKYADADQVRGIMGNFISPQGADLQSVPPDLLIITDIGLNIRRIERLIETIDRAGGGEVVRLVQIRYAAAKDIADKVNQIFALGAGAPGKGKRTVLSAARPTSPPAPPIPGAPPAPAAAAGGPTEVNITKVIPDDRTNKLIVIADEKSFDRIQELVQQLDVPTAESGGIHVIFLKNAAAEDLATTLSNLAQGKSGKTSPSSGAPTGLPGQPPRPATPAGAGGAVTADLFTGDVKVTADKTQNALVVQASGADIVTVRRLVEKLDRPRRQVFVEAVIMEVNINNSNAFGVGMHGAIPVDGKNGTGFIPIGVSPGRINTIGPLGNVQNIIGLGGFLTGYAGPVSASLKDLGLNIPSIGIMVQALQTSSDVNVISTPHILASDNQDAEITVGQNVPFQAAYAPTGLSSLAGATGSTTTGSALGSLLGTQGLNSLYAPIQRQPVELRLKIKPQISEGDNIRLIVDEQTEEIVDKDPQLGPTTAKRTVKTEIMAKDQSTIVIGGLIQERNVRSVKKVPFLGSLPILGWLFRDTTTTKSKTNLLLFLTPYIIRDESDYRRIYEKKRKEQQDFMELFYGRSTDYEYAVDYARKPGPFARLRRDVLEETAKPENGGSGGPGDRVVGPDAPSRAVVTPVPVPAGEPAAPPTGRSLPDGSLEPLDVQPEVPALQAPPFPSPPTPVPPPPVPPEGQLP
jgi:general secretion pathway protein D